MPTHSIVSQSRCALNARSPLDITLVYDWGQMDIAETLFRARVRDMMLGAFATHVEGLGDHHPFWSSEFTQLYCRCGTLFTRTEDIKVVEEEIPALFDG